MKNNIYKVVLTDVELMLITDKLDDGDSHDSIHSKLLDKLMGYNAGNDVKCDKKGNVISH